jgi:hypothetical protein
VVLPEDDKNSVQSSRVSPKWEIFVAHYFSTPEFPKSIHLRAMISTVELSKLLPIPGAPPLSSKARRAFLIHLIAGGRDTSGENTGIAVEYEARA